MWQLINWIRELTRNIRRQPTVQFTEIVPMTSRALGNAPKPSSSGGSENRKESSCNKCDQVDCKHKMFLSKEQLATLEGVLEQSYYPAAPVYDTPRIYKNVPQPSQI